MEHQHTNKDIELRSEEVQEVMGSIPTWIVRWGITGLCGVVMVILIGSYFFRYPDVVTAEMTLTGRYPAAQVVSRSTGKISGLKVTDGQEVTAGTTLAVIENPAITGDMLFLKNLLALHANDADSLLYELPESRELVLGDVQAIYTTFIRSLHEYRNYMALDYYPQKIAATHEQIARYWLYEQNLRRQQELAEAQHIIARQQYGRDSLLFIREVIAPSEHEVARTAFLQSRQSVENAAASLDNLSIQIASLEVTLLDLRLQEAEKESMLRQDLQTTAGQLMNAIHGWELAYCLTAPIEGKVTFTRYWSMNQYIPAGETVFTVVPRASDELMGKALLPAARSGKVKTEQRVIVRFVNYPDQEFGMVNGIVKTISLVPTDGQYVIEVGFPHGLITNYGKTLPVSHEMIATAEIVTEDLRLIERLFMPVKKILKEGRLSENYRGHI
jgi:HlyD family secretion protein